MGIIYQSLKALNNVILGPRKVTHRVISKFKKPSRFFKIISITPTNGDQFWWFIIYECKSGIHHSSCRRLPPHEHDSEQEKWLGGQIPQKSSKLQIEGYELKVTERTPQSNHFENCFAVNNYHVNLHVLSLTLIFEIFHISESFCSLRSHCECSNVLIYSKYLRRPRDA